MTAAADTYAIGRATALDLLAKLQQAIENMPEPKSINGNWCYALHMAFINGQLRELLDFAGGDDV